MISSLGTALRAIGIGAREAGKSQQRGATPPHRPSRRRQAGFCDELSAPAGRSTPNASQKEITVLLN
jgi:hypothetical protein